MIIKIITLLAVITAIFFLIMYININHKLKNANITITNKQKKEIEIESEVENVKDHMKLIYELYTASDTLINITNEDDVYKEIYNQIIKFFKCKQLLLYSYDDEQREYTKKYSSNEMINLPDSIKYKDMKVQDSLSPKQISKMVINTQKKPLYYIQIAEKRSAVGNNMMDSVFVDTDFQILDIYLKQSAMVLEKIKAYKKMERMALTDNLTGLYNRHYAHMRIKQEIKRANREQYSVSIVFADIDKFKSVNDTYGHDVGDLALKYIAEILRSVTREYDICVRWGGEEFVMFLPNTDEMGGYALAERLRLSVEEGQFEYCPLTISLGVSTYPQDDLNIDKVINNADTALYFSKQSGRNKVTIYNDVKHMV